METRTVPNSYSCLCERRLSNLPPLTYQLIRFVVSKMLLKVSDGLFNEHFWKKFNVEKITKKTFKTLKSVRYIYGTVYCAETEWSLRSVHWGPDHPGAQIHSPDAGSHVAWLAHSHACIIINNTSRQCNTWQS